MSAPSVRVPDEVARQLDDAAHPHHQPALRERRMTVVESYWIGCMCGRDTVSDPMNHALACPIRTAAAHSQPKCETCGRFARSLVSVPVIGSVTPEQVCCR